MTLLPCPHCGGQPSFGCIEEMDDRRYIQLDLSCCSTLYSRIDWSYFSKMTEAEQIAELQADLTHDWNKRYPLPGTLTAEQVEELIACWDGIYVDSNLDVGRHMRKYLAKLLEDQ